MLPQILKLCPNYYVNYLQITHKKKLMILKG